MYLAQSPLDMGKRKTKAKENTECISVSTFSAPKSTQQKRTDCIEIQHFLPLESKQEKENMYVQLFNSCNTSNHDFFSGFGQDTPMLASVCGYDHGADPST